MTIKPPWPSCPTCPGQKLASVSTNGVLVWRCLRCGYERDRWGPIGKESTPGTPVSPFSKPQPIARGWGAIIFSAWPRMTPTWARVVLLALLLAWVVFVVVVMVPG